MLQNVVPLLSSPREVEGGYPHLVALGRALGAKEAVASVELAKWVLLAVIGREGHLVIMRNGRGFGFQRHVGEGWRHMHDGG